MKLQRPLEKFYAFLDQPLIFAHRVAIAVSVAFLVLAFFFPLWRISMEAPQYPNGLWMDIWAYDLVGGGENGRHIQEINTLNHYIGMHRIERADFADLDWMPFAFGLLAILALRVAAIGNVRSLIDLAVITTYVLLFAGARFVYKLYVFGHDLDPAAPFDVEPFMPVIIGSKQIANFTTHSMPQLGTLWVTLFAVTVALSAGWHLVAGRRAAVRLAREAKPVAAAVTVAAALALAVFAIPAAASACPTCAVGDPTLTTMGTEQSYAGRTRVGVEARQSEMELHQGAARLWMVERRLDACLSFAPWERWVFALDVPFAHRSVGIASGTRIEATGIGDVEVGARLQVWADRPTFTRHHLAVRASVDLPTAYVAGSSQASLPHEAMPGTGSLDGRLAFLYGWLSDPWSGFGQVTGTVESENDGFRNGPSLLVSGGLQYQPGPAAALGLRADWRLDAPAEHHGTPEPDTGGTVLYIGPQVLASLAPEVLLAVSVRAPVIQAFRGDHREGPMLTASVTVEP